MSTKYIEEYIAWKDKQIKDLQIENAKLKEEKESVEKILGGKISDLSSIIDDLNKRIDIIVGDSHGNTIKVKTISIKDINATQVINCETEEEAKRICKIMDNVGFKWRNGDRYLETYWDRYKERTCYQLSGGFYADIAYFRTGKPKEIISSKLVTE